MKPEFSTVEWGNSTTVTVGFLHGESISVTFYAYGNPDVGTEMSIDDRDFPFLLLAAMVLISVACGFFYFSKIIGVAALAVMLAVAGLLAYRSKNLTPEQALRQRQRDALLPIELDLQAFSDDDDLRGGLMCAEDAVKKIDV